MTYPKTPSAPLTANPKGNAKHLRCVEVEIEGEDGLPTVEQIPSGQLLENRRKALGLTPGQLREGLALRGVVMTTQGLSMWYSGKVSADKFGAVADTLYPGNKGEAMRFHNLLLRTIIPEGSLARFDELIEIERRHKELQFREMLRQRNRRKAAAGS